MNTRLIGRWGEQTAAAFLKTKGYTIIAMGYTCRYGEIDIIAEDADYLVFAEVKLRKAGDLLLPREYVTYAKQQKIIRTASMWLAQNETDKQPRFDVLELTMPQREGAPVGVRHLPDAFQAD